MNKDYYETGKASLKQELENDPVMWNNWVNYDKKYKLISTITIVENDLNQGTGKVTGRIHFGASSDSIDDLKRFWAHSFMQSGYDSTVQHFIVDTEEKKVVEFLSVCM